uniref:Putative secreted protein n=1 Tax=Anopheles triannulatus TaxID=58253 RepID=A0A2M4B3D9_9DIPT
MAPALPPLALATPWVVGSSVSILMLTDSTLIELFSFIVTVHPDNRSFSMLYSFSIVRIGGPGSSSLIFEMNRITCRSIPASLKISSMLMSEILLSFITRMPWIMRRRFGSGGWALYFFTSSFSIESDVSTGILIGVFIVHVSPLAGV